MEIYIVVFIICQLHSTPAKQHIISLLSQHCLISSESAKTYDIPAVKSIFAFTSGRSNKTRASLFRRQISIPEIIQSCNAILPESQIFQIAVFVCIAHEQLLFYPEKKLMKVSLSVFLCKPQQNTNNNHSTLTEK